MNSSRSRRPLSRRLRERIEHYTPDGALGRWLLGSVVGTAGLWFLGLALFDPTLTLLWSVLLFGLAAPSLLFAGLVLWPVYLSLIGNLESAADYSTGDAADAGTEPGSETDDEEDPVAILKRRYASGEITEAEFERRLEGLLDADSVDRSRIDANGGQPAATERRDLERDLE